MADVRAFFRTNPTPIHFISPTAFNLLGLDRWVRNLFYVNYYDSFENHHPRVFVPPSGRPAVRVGRGDLQLPARPKECVAFIEQQGPGGKAAFVMFDEETERLAAEAGLEIIHPPAALRKRLDRRSSTPHRRRSGRAERAERARPGWLLRASCRARRGHGIGDDLVVQTPYGDSGRTTFFVRTGDDFAKDRDDWSRRSSR